MFRSVCSQTCFWFNTDIGFRLLNKKHIKEVFQILVGLGIASLVSKTMFIMDLLLNKRFFFSVVCIDSVYL